MDQPLPSGVGRTIGHVLGVWKRQIRIVELGDPLTRPACSAPSPGRPDLDLDDFDPDNARVLRPASYEEGNVIDVDFPGTPLRMGPRPGPPGTHANQQFRDDWTQACLEAKVAHTTVRQSPIRCAPTDVSTRLPFFP